MLSWSERFKGVEIDGKFVDPSNYDVVKGSARITLHAFPIFSLSSSLKNEMEHSTPSHSIMLLFFVHAPYFFLCGSEI